MSFSVLRTADGWWLAQGDGKTARRITTTATTTRELLGDRSALLKAREDAAGKLTEISELGLVSPVTAPSRVVAQMTNFVSHVLDSGMDPKTIPLTFFRKASASICGPFDDVVRPAHVKFLDYEVEIGLVIGDPIPVGTQIDEGTLGSHIAALVVTNDVSARDVQLPQTQFYEAKSYPTFTPVGPVLLVLEDGELSRFDELALRLSVNGEIRQDSTVADMIYRPLEALRALARFQPLETGDLILTGTPGGTALKAPAKIVGMVAALLPPAVRWKSFFKSQAKNPKYLQDGDVIEASVATPDGALDLGTQKNRVRFDA